ncbi:ABC transporter permease [Gynuella sunshinyii]|uniref:ABC-type transport system, involved in lipoprotein release, permease component n=1 Tax=Gynuella sunshinyii YC6258 TaxID=1445510 RepID=A0A0C5VC94_9GAMM|nr:ABC transporter permease [Gynuella sunshinyii]AJQ96970.1 ABC-type transport system, involved in lipoprotein release, permease component [Gynuella sunshinyii YC6258]
MNWMALAWQSLRNRKSTAILTLFMMALSVCMVLTVDRIRTDTRASFSNTLSGTDLLVGARTGSLNLLLYSVFRIGNATNNISWQSYQELAHQKDIAWTIPISLGDSHKGFRVLGTNDDYLKHYQYGNKQALKVAQGKWFNDIYQVVLGAEVAHKLNYHIGDEVIISHGTGSASFSQHKDKPFTVSGILAPTGTPVDRTLHIPLEGMTAIHVDWQAGAKIPGLHISADKAKTLDLTPDTITAFLVGMKSRLKTFAYQRAINDYRAEPLMAVIPGAALQELWQLIGIAENALIAVSIMVVITGLMGMLTVILSSLNERRREIAIFRALGARRRTILWLLMVESGFYGIAGLIFGLLLHWLLIAIASIYIQNSYGIGLTIGIPANNMLIALAVFATTAVLLGLIPGYRAYRQSLTDGLTTRT